ncbi:hypothetical protein BRW65_15545 [Mycobacterium paraffinicum]|uniref:Uncharacterized protein n=1 Tax=Mycobacterium paraffinicum TaxID=53378 RepID=A0A1Q4HTG4_9MYCO|nr:hypothetical protein [Mycobacterium paraffinicum]OJZ72903.1 hypothetical protein BRW65_15545 [Mycobacterium paraffinicum]
MNTKRSRAAALLAAGVLGAAGLLTAGVGIGHAETIQTEGNYPTREACQNAGPGVKASTPGNWNNFWCIPDRNVNGNWKLVLSN